MLAAPSIVAGIIISLLYIVRIISITENSVPFGQLCSETPQKGADQRGYCQREVEDAQELLRLMSAPLPVVCAEAM